jgi:hypothetical protein
MSFISSIFTLKPIIDILHGDAMRYVDQINELQCRIVELEKENKLLKEINSTSIKIEKEINVIKEKPIPISKNIVIDDTVFTKEAETFVEPVNVVVENTEKVVVVNTEKSRKEYQQEYQRQYRKQKKEQQNK